MIGTSKAAQTGNADGTTAVTSALAANAGSLSITAGTDAQYRDNKGSGQGKITTQGADLLAKDSISLSGNAVDLQAISSTSRSATQSQTRSATLGSTLTGAIGAAITAISDNIALAQNTDNSRLQGAAALKAGYDAYKLGSGLAQAASTGQNPMSSESAIGVSISLSVGKSSQSTADSNSSARGTNLQAGKIRITSREGDISASGAKLQASDISLDAARNLFLTAAANHSTVQTQNASSSTGVGVTLALGGAQNGLSFQASAARTSGHSNGSETIYDNTQVTASDNLRIRSGGDTTLQGAQLAGQNVTADIGGNLNIQTLQDQSQYTSEQKNAGFSLSLCIPPLCEGVPVTGSVNYGKSSIDHNYQSATGQSGIAAGDKAGAGGFDIQVAGNTDLQGGAITSTASAGHNRLQTASVISPAAVTIICSQLSLAARLASHSRNKTCAKAPVRPTTS
jgi:filamentous hemagglutinin